MTPQPQGHTPGPESDHAHYVISDGICETCGEVQDKPKGPAPCWVDTTVDPPEFHCPRRAINAALLAALEPIVARFTENEAMGISTDEYEAAVAALALARGET